MPSSQEPFDVDPEHNWQGCATDDQADFEREFYGAILRRNPNYVDVLRRQVELLARRGHYDQALPLDERLAHLQPEDCVVRYNYACSLCMTGHIEEAIFQLRMAIELGYDDFAHLEADSDLDAVREHPGFVKMLMEFGVAD
ncbi:MAG: tetratricopeptide repeat protein [Pirellulaceae bacterium]|nr:tetratricopeptide repeat protein [Planctomycetales bacterium]